LQSILSDILLLTLTKEQTVESGHIHRTFGENKSC